EGQLLREEELEAGETWATAHPNDVTPLEHAYLDESLRAREQAEKEKAQAQHIAMLFRVASVVSIVCVALLVVAAILFGRSEADKATAQAEATRATQAQATAEAEALNATNAKATAQAEALNATNARATAQAEADHAAV